jgi:hypothetical protein
MITELLRIVRKLDKDDEHSELFNIINMNRDKRQSLELNQTNLSDLLIGSSILKEFASKDKKLQIKSKSGAKVNHVTTMLKDYKDNTFNTVTLVVGVQPALIVP